MEKTNSSLWTTIAAGSAAMMVLLASSALVPAAAETSNIVGLKNGTLGFALTSAQWGIYQTEEGKQECPQGFNDGPREQFKELYPNGGTVVGTQLERESATRFPTEREDKFPFHMVEGKIGIGMNLDGKIGPNDFTSPTGEKGIDNQLYRTIGCVRMFRGEASYAHFTELWVREMSVNRILVELTGVDNLTNDDHVQVTLYRGKDNLMMNAAANAVMPGGSNRIDDRFSKRFTKTLNGRIEKGVLITEPTDISWVWSPWYSLPGYYDFKQARLQVTLAPDGQQAEGMMGGYVDVDSFYQQIMRGWSTHHSSYGSMSEPSLARALNRMADGIPDEHGKNTALSSSLQLRFVQVFIQHPEKSVAAATQPVGATVTASQR